MIGNVTSRTRNSDAKETLFINALRCDWLVGFSIKEDVYCARVRTKHSDLHVVTNLVRT
jgi:hypothetical protein